MVVIVVFIQIDTKNGKALFIGRLTKMPFRFIGHIPLINEIPSLRM